MNIPDEVVREMSDTFRRVFHDHGGTMTKGWRAAAEVAVKWAREKDAELCKPQPDEAWEKDAVWAGNYIASRIRNQKD